MITAKIPSRHDIEKVMFNDEIYENTNPDGTQPKELCNIHKANLEGWNFIGGYIAGEIASLFIVHNSQMHFWVLKEFRKHARELLAESFKLWPYDVFVKIPKLYQSTINFARKVGFKTVDIEKKNYMKNSKLYDTEVMRFTWEV